MPESAAEIHARVVARTGEGGRLPTPAVVEWDIFPWQAEGGAIVTRPLAPPAPEEPRKGVDGVDCPVCASSTADGVIWRDDTWRVKHLPERGGLPITVLLETHEHLDFTDLDERQAARLGILTVRLARIVESLPNIARCHVSRWGDGAEHCHVWFFGRTEGLLSTRGSLAVEWDAILPPGPEDVWRADLAEIARKLATHGGEALG
jgi:hypothetical protein